MHCAEHPDPDPAGREQTHNVVHVSIGTTDLPFVFCDKNVTLIHRYKISFHFADIGPDAILSSSSVHIHTNASHS